MKTFILALVGILGLTLGVPSAEARDRKHKHHDHHDRSYYHHDHHYRHFHHPRGYYYRSYDYRPSYYYPSTRYYYYDDDPWVPRYRYHRRPAVTFSFGL